MSSYQATSSNLQTSSNPTPSSAQGEDSDPDSPPASSLTPSSPDPRSPSLPRSSPMPNLGDVESNIGSNDAHRNYTEFSRLLRSRDSSFQGDSQREYGAADTGSSLCLADEGYETDDVGSPEWSRLGLDTSGWDNAQSLVLVTLILVVLVVSVIAVFVRIS